MAYEDWNDNDYYFEYKLSYKSKNLISKKTPIRQKVTPPAAEFTSNEDMEEDEEHYIKMLTEAEQEYNVHLKLIKNILNSSKYLPPSLTQKWIFKLTEVDFFNPSRGVWIHEDLAFELHNASKVYTPFRSGYNMSISHTIMFEREIDMIKHELNCLKKLLHYTLNCID